MSNSNDSKIEHFEPLDLRDCRVPIGCPYGADCPEDAFPNHHGSTDSSCTPLPATFACVSNDRTSVE